MLKVEFPITYYMCDKYTWKRPSLYIRENPISSSDMTSKDYGRKGSLAKKIYGRHSRGVWCQDHLIGFQSVSQTLYYLN
jgi:hypothetical protein